MFVLIAGAGTLGFELVKHLTTRKIDLVVIEQRQEICDEVFARFGFETICGDATNISVLDSAGIKKADMVIATMRNDAANLAFSVLARSFTVPEIVVRMNHTSYAEAYHTAGVTKLLNAVDHIVSEILYQVDKPAFQTLARLGDGAVEIFIVSIPENGKIVGKTISEIAAHRRLPEESIIAGIFNKTDNVFKVPRGNTRIQGESDLFVITRPELVKKTARVLLR